MKRAYLSITVTSMLLLLGACGVNNLPPVEDENTSDTQTEVEENQVVENDHDEMEHDESGEIPAGLTTAADPEFPIGTEVILHTDHMEGMNGAEAIVVGAFDTVVYSVSYTPTDGSDPVEEHKWVVQEELREATEGPFKPGDEVTLEAKHMAGMEGAKATIDQVEDTTVYMVDYTPTSSNEIVRNHKWVIEDEISPQVEDNSEESADEQEPESPSLEDSESIFTTYTGRGIYKNQNSADQITVEIDGQDREFYLTREAQSDLEYLYEDEEVAFSYYKEEDENIIDYIEPDSFNRRFPHHNHHHNRRFNR
ncbi:MAG TPA: DUF1541 domain-containing protein [Atopostipes sp.]|nr:DUF1541 domain-containing protein [Atopostipes sp.]